MHIERLEITGDAIDDIKRHEAEAEWRGDDEDTWASDDAEAYYADWCKRAPTLVACEPEEGPDGNEIPTYRLN